MSRKSIREQAAAFDAIGKAERERKAAKQAQDKRIAMRLKTLNRMYAWALLITAFGVCLGIAAMHYAL